MKLLSRYLIKDILSSFFIGFISFLSIFLITQIFKISDLIVVHNVDFKDVIRLVVFILIPFIGATIPVALLFSILVSLGRLSIDNELVALNASGIGLNKIIKPILFLSVILFFISFIFMSYIDVWGFNSLKRLIFNISHNKISTGILPNTFNEDFYNLVIYVEEYNQEEGLLKNIILFDEREKDKAFIILAKEGKIITNEEEFLIAIQLTNGSLLFKKTDREASRKISFDSYTLNLFVDTSKEFSIYDPRAYYTNQLIKKIYESTNNIPIRNQYIAEIQRRLAIPLSCIIFAIFALVLAGSKINSREAFEKSKATMICLLIVITYWIMTILFKSLANKSIVLASIFFWLPNMIFLSLGIYLFLYKMKRIV